MTPTQGKWPILLAVGLLCLLTLLSVASWSGNGPLHDRMSMANSDQPENSAEDQAAEIRARFAEPALPQLPVPAPKPKLNRYQQTFGGAATSGSSEDPKLSDPKADQTAQRPLPIPQQPQLDGVKEISNDDSDSTPHVDKNATADWPIVTKQVDPDQFIENARLQAAFGDSENFDFRSVKKNQSGTDHLAQQQLEIPIDPDLNLENQSIEQQLLAQFEPHANDQDKSQGSQKPGAETDSAGNVADEHSFLPDHAELQGLTGKRRITDFKIVDQIKPQRPVVPKPSANSAVEKNQIDPDQEIIDLITQRDSIDMQPATRAERATVLDQSKPKKLPARSVSQSDTQIAVLPANTAKRQPDDDVPKISTPPETVRQPTRPRRSFPKSSALLVDLEAVSQFELAAEWGRDTKSIVAELLATEDVADERVATTINRLYRQIIQLDLILKNFTDQHNPSHDERQAAAAGALHRVRYQLHRRLEIWTAAYRLAARGESVADTKQQHLLASSQSFDFELVPVAWRDYLHLDELRQVFRQQGASAQSRKRVARKVLARATANHLTPQQSQYIEKILGPELATILRLNATEKTDLRDLLIHLEEFELTRDGIPRFYLNDHYQSLYWSADSHANFLADLINVHYRNANLRVSVSESLINRWIPQHPVSPVAAANDRSLGSQGFGHNVVSNGVRVDLLPAPQAWRIRLKSSGKISSRMRTQREAMGFQDYADSEFTATKDMDVSPFGPKTQTTQVRATSHSRAPIYQGNHRRLASHGSGNPTLTSSLLESKIRTATRERFDEIVATQLGIVSDTIRRKWLIPLATLDLEPEALQMTTTQDRMMVRYRIAGQDQMAANTARPMAVKNSVVSAQVHESAINNFIAKTGIAGKKFTMPEFASYLNRTLGYRVIVLAEHHEDEVEFTLSRIDPLKLEFDQHHLAVTIRLRNLRVGKSVWKNIAVTCPYNISAQGLQLHLTKRDPGIRLIGKRLRLRDQIAIRSIFHKVIGQDYEFSLGEIPMLKNLNLSGLWISQLVFADGWAGISINDETTLPKPGQTPPSQRKTHRLSDQSKTSPQNRIR